MSRTIRIGALALLLLFLPGLGYLLYQLTVDFWWPVSFVEGAKERTRLIDGLESYQSIDEARAWLAARSLTWQVIADDHLAPDDRRPPFSIYSVTIKEFSHLDCPGELTVTFLNNRLMSTVFYPNDLKTYLDRLVTRDGIRFVADPKRPDSLEATLAPYTRVWSFRDYQGRGYVAWADTRLEKEESIWTMRYA